MATALERLLGNRRVKAKAMAAAEAGQTFKVQTTDTEIYYAFLSVNGDRILTLTEAELDEARSAGHVFHLNIAWELLESNEDGSVSDDDDVVLAKLYARKVRWRKMIWSFATVIVYHPSADFAVQMMLCFRSRQRSKWLRSPRWRSSRF